MNQHGISPRSYEKYYRFSLGSLYLVIGFAALCLLGWKFEIGLFMDWTLGRISMNPLTAICLILCGFSLLLWEQKKTGNRRHLVQLLCLILLVTSSTRLFSLDQKMGIRLDQILFKPKLNGSIEHAFPNKMAITTSISFILFSLSIFLQTTGENKWRFWSRAAFFCLGTIALFTLIGYVYDTDVLHHYLSFSPMAFNTAVCFLLLSLCPLILYHRSFIRHFIHSYKGAKIARLFLPLAIILPVSLGFFRLWGEQHQWYPLEVGMAVFTLANILLLVVLIFQSSSYLNRFELRLRREIAKRKNREQQLKEFQQNLEGIIQDRTEQLYQNEQRFRSLIENSSDAISLIDEEGLLRYQTPSAEKLFGYPMEERIGTSVFNNVPEEGLQAARQLLEQAKKHPRVVMPFASTIRHRSGKLIQIEGKINNLLNEPSVKAIVLNYSDVTEKVHLTRELDRKEKEQQRELLRSALNAEERERTKIGEELHDNINQVLTSAKLYMEMAAADENNRVHFISRGKEIVNRGIEEIRKLSGSLVTPRFEKTDFLMALTEFTDLISQARAIRFERKVNGFRPDLLKEGQKVLLYRIIQEQLNNIIKHAEATAVSITLDQEEGRLTLLVVDNGKGFDTKVSRKGIGLSNMQHRVSLYKGTVELHSETNKGTRLFVSIPLEE
ncbi:MAG: PAS domain-containing sensor histidine kinase [Flavisolibacter sp.]